MKCVNTKCKNKITDGMGFFMVLHNTQAGNRDSVFTRWICASCFNLLEIDGFARRWHNLPADNKFLVREETLQVVGVGARPSEDQEAHAWLYAHWIPQVGWRNVEGVIQLYRSPITAASACTEYPVCVFFANEPARIPPWLSKFKVNE